MHNKFLSFLLAVCMIISILPAAIAAPAFNDVDTSTWYADAVEWAYNEGLMNGTDKNAFSPDTTTTRGMIVTVLWRMEGEPAAAGIQFNDVDKDAYYAKAVLWAAANKIVEGYGDGRFGPNDQITREQLATILFRYAQHKGYDVSVGENTNILSYDDAFTVSSWAIPAMQWACGAGLIKGIAQGSAMNLDPQGKATRAQVAVILYRCVEEAVFDAENDKPYFEPIVHVHEYGPWVGNGDGTHTKTCACGTERVQDCRFGDFVTNEDGTHSRTCSVCDDIDTEACIYEGDEVKSCGICGHEIDERNILQPKATAAENYTMLMDAIRAAEDGDVIYLAAGVYEVDGIIVVDGKSISLVGEGEDLVTIKKTQSSHIFTLQDSADPEGNRHIVLSNMTLDGGKISKHGINAKYDVTVDLHNLTIKDTGWAAILLDNGNNYGTDANGAGIYYNDTETKVNARNVDLQGANGFVSMDALPMANTSMNHTTYASLNYDAESNIPTYEVQANNRGYGNLTINGEPVYPKIYLMEEDGIQYIYDSVNDTRVLRKVSADYPGTTLELPEGVVSIGGYAFAYNHNLKTIVLPSTVKTLQDRAFRDTSASSVALNEGLTNISYQAFRNASNITSVEIPSTVTTISREAFQHSGVKSLVVPETVTTLEYGALRDMKELETITIEGNIHIPSYALRSCTKLRTVYFNGDDVTFQSGTMLISNYDTGDASAITVYVRNETVKQRLIDAYPSANYTIVVVDEAKPGVLQQAGTKNYLVTSKEGLLNVASIIEDVAHGEGTALNFKLQADIDLAGVAWEPLHMLFVNFDGNGHTISNLTASGWKVGFAAYVGGSSITNLTLENVQVTGAQAGTFMGAGEGATVTNSFLKGTNTVTFAPYSTESYTEKWNGIGAVTGVLQASTINVEIAEGAVVTLNRGEMTTDPGCTYVDDLTGHIAANNGTVVNKGTVTATGALGYAVATAAGLNNAIAAGLDNIVLTEPGTYKMPSSGTNATITITGTKDTIVDVTLGAYLESATLVFEGVTIKGSTGMANGGGSDYAALYSANVTYKKCTFSGPFRIGRDGAKFIECTFNDLGNDYVWTYGNDATFERCTFNSNGKALLIYSDGGSEVSKVSVTGCIFNATAGAKAGAIANQNCAAIEIHNYGNGVNLTTSENTYDSNFSGEWRIKTYESGKPAVIVNGTTYTTIAIDGKLMTIDASKNVTVVG